MNTNLMTLAPCQTGTTDTRSGWLALEYVGEKIPALEVSRLWLSLDGKSAELDMEDGSIKTIQIISHKFGNAHVRHSM